VTEWDEKKAIRAIVNMLEAWRGNGAECVYFSALAGQDDDDPTTLGDLVRIAYRGLDSLKMFS